MGNIHTVGPNEALVVSGGCSGAISTRIIIGGWAWAWWLTTNVQRLSLQVFTLNPRCEDVETSLGVKVSVTGVAQVKVMNESQMLRTAAELFLGMKMKQIRATIITALEGHLRAILATLTVEEVYRDHEKFAALVREVAGVALSRMGIEILSFTIKDVTDKVEYLSSLGKARIAIAQSIAKAHVAQANRDAGIFEAEMEKAAMDAKFATMTKMHNNERQYKLEKAQNDTEVNAAKARAELAYDLQAAKTKQHIRHEEMEIEVVEKRKLIEIEEHEIKCQELRMNANILLPTLATSYSIEVIAEGNRTMVLQEARGEADRIKRIGEAQAKIPVGPANARRMQIRADAFKQYGQSALVAMVLENLPRIAAEVSAPLCKIDEIVVLGSSSEEALGDGGLNTVLSKAKSWFSGIDLAKTGSEESSSSSMGRTLKALGSHRRRPLTEEFWENAALDEVLENLDYTSPPRHKVLKTST